MVCARSVLWENKARAKTANIFARVLAGECKVGFIKKVFRRLVNELYPKNRTSIKELYY